MLPIQALQISHKKLHVSEFVLNPKNRSVVRQQWIRRLWTSGDPDAASMLVALLEDKNPDIRFCAAQGLGWLSEDTEIFDAEIRQMRIRFEHEENDPVKEALRVALEAIEQNKKNPKLATPEDLVSKMFVKVDDDKPKGLPFLNFQPPLFLQDLPFSMGISGPNAGIKMSDIGPDTELFAMPVSSIGGMPSFMDGSVSDVQQAVEGLSEEQKDEGRKKILKAVIAALKRSKSGQATFMDTMLITGFRIANSILPEDKRAKARELIDRFFPNDVELLRENGFY